MELEDVGSSGHLKMSAMLKTVGSDLKHFAAKNKGKWGSARAWPVAAPMPKSDSFFIEKRECLDCLVLAFRFCVPFTVGVAMYL